MYIFFFLLPTHAKLRAEKKEFINSIGMEFILISKGTFMMGSNTAIVGLLNFNNIFDKFYIEEKFYESEMPKHKVIINKNFYMGKYEVTQAQWFEVMGFNPSENKGKERPVVNVSWYDAIVFIKRLNNKEGHNKYRLPTEAEWEYAAKAGSETFYSFGNDVNQLEYYSWCGCAADHNPAVPSQFNKVKPVGRKLPNPWGLYDMHGNAIEWVQDWFDNQYYQKSPELDPGGPQKPQEYRVVRGGGIGYGSWHCRSAYRGAVHPERRQRFLGFRLALSIL
jgi:formylglycine-generating enzyme required for sulfatase activity